MEKYKVSVSRLQVATKIESVEVVKETEKQVVVLSRYKDWVTGKEKTSESRCAKSSDYYRYFDTWEDAHMYLSDEAERLVQKARLELEQAKGRQGNVKGMKKPL